MQKPMKNPMKNIDKNILYILFLGLIYLIVVYNAISYYRMKYRIAELDRLIARYQELLNRKKIILIKKTSPFRLKKIAESEFGLRFKFSPNRVYTIEIEEER
jgi:cell division protein FtsL